MKIKHTVIGLLTGAFLMQAGEPVAKQAGVCFRFDDRKPVAHWNGMAELFDKYGYKLSLAITSQDTTQPAEHAALKAIADRGHSIMDHLPNHAVYKIIAHSQQEFDEYAKLPAVDHVNAATRTVYFKYELNLADPGNRTFNAEITGGKLQNFPAELAGELGYTRKIYHPQTGQVYGITFAGSERLLLSFWGEKVTVPDYKGELVMLARNSAVQPSDALMRFLAETTRRNFSAMGLPAPKAWIQPGGWEECVAPDRIERIYGKEFGYISADCRPGSNDRYACAFNDSDPVSGRYTMLPDFTAPDNGQNIAAMKHNIADSIAKNRVKIFISHMSVNRVNGGWDAYLKDYDELLAWIKANSIPVKTQEEWADVLYSQKPVANTNVMPALTRDLDGDGKPDGYELLNGAKADLTGGTVTIPAGGKLHISDVAGLEKGATHFSLMVKGAPGTNVIIDFFFVVRHGDNYIERKQFRINSADWTKLEGTVTVKPEAMTLHYGVSFSNATEAIEVKEPVFRQ